MNDWTGDRIRALEREVELLGEALGACREREQRYGSLFDAMIEGFGLAEILLDEQGRPCDYRLLEVNEAFGRLTGFPPAAAKGKTAREFLPELEPHWIDIYGRVALTGEPARFENYVEGLGKWFEVFAYRTAPGQFAHLFVDITERKRLEEMRRREQEFRTLAENTPEHIARYDRSLRYVYVNPAMAASTGISREHFIGKTDHELGFPEQLVGDWERRTRRVFETAHAERVEFHFPTPEGMRYFESHLVPEFGANGQVETVLADTRDLTAHKRALETLERTTHDLGERIKELNGLYTVASLTQQRSPQERFTD